MASDLKERVIKNSFWSLIAAIISRIGALVFTVILARFLLPERFGMYSIVLSVSMIFYTLTDIGINQSMVRYLSYSLVHEKKKLAAYHSFFFKIKVILALASSITLFVLAYPISFYVFHNSALFAPLLTSAFYILIMSLQGYYTNIFFSIEKVRFNALIQSVEVSLKIAFSLFIFFFIASSYQILGIFAGYALISLFLLIFCLYYFKKNMPYLFFKSKERIDKKKIFKFVGYITIASISTVLFSYIDSIIIGFYLSAEYVGFYRAAYSLVLGIIGILGFASSMLLAFFTKLEENASFKLFNKAFAGLSAIAIPSLFGVIILGRYFIRLLFGYDFLPSAFPLYFLSALILPVTLVNLFLMFFSAKGKPHIFARLILITSTANIILNLVFVRYFMGVSPLWATCGAALASVISWVFYLFAFVWFARKEFNIRPPLFYLLKPLFASIAMSVFMILSIRAIGDMNLFWGIFEVVFGGLVYLLALLMLKGFSISELKSIKLVIKKS